MCGNKIGTLITITARQKKWRPAPCASKAKELLCNDRLMWSRKNAAIIGHGPYNYHDRKVDPVDGPDFICERCDQGVPQYASHILKQCDAFAELRIDIFFRRYQPEDLTQITDHQLRRQIHF